MQKVHFSLHDLFLYWRHKDCGSFAGAINWIDCNEGPDSCYAYSDDDCVYTGDRMGEWGVGNVQLKNDKTMHLTLRFDMTVITSY